ncbi:MAG: hypothetical protein H0U03_05955 [Actinobacteria bacterium]|nr:hypothetical protein [Actinomycetota bacterium]MBA3556313.1 hypothetical protein [Gemmatimonadales bacterium]
MEVLELQPGLWRWTAPHPDWTPDEGGPDGWDPIVGCLYHEAPDAVVLIDPLVPAGEEGDRFWRALDRDVERAGRPVAVLLTVFWHERSAPAVMERYGASLWADERGLDRLSVAATHTVRPGHPLPGGIHAFDAVGRNELVLWLPEHHALVPGDILLGGGNGDIRLCPESWLHRDQNRQSVRRALRHLLELPIEQVLLSHGEPVLERGHEALAKALAA